ncbi:hypothetical protein [Streptomyces sp. NPDC050534]|uniref:hypothetical protein n=1 Tax=Streptomyces sp. NPDC050534 TaxID=3365625 RepID=UPI0037B2F50E
MTDTRPTPPSAAAAHHERPFTDAPGRWEKERGRALRTGHLPGHTCTAACEPVLVVERTGWGWLAWPVPQDGGTPEHPQQMGVLTPAATRAQHLALRWLTRRPARHIARATLPGSVRLSTACAALFSLLTAVFAARHGLPIGVVLPAMFLAPLLAEHLPDRLDALSRDHVRTVDGDGPCRYLQRLAALHTCLVRAAAGSTRYEVRRSAEIGRQLLWDAAGLLQTQDPRSPSAELIARKRLMLQLVHQVSQMLPHTADAATATAPGAHDACTPGRSLGPNPFGARPATHPAPRPAPTPPLQKGPSPVPHTAPRQAAALDVYLLFAHEPYYPAAAREINATVVAAACLLHPRVRQPDGARIHARLVHGRRPGEIVPLSTLSHELDGGARWPQVADWQTVTEDLLQVIRDHDCDALGLGLPEIARALVCVGPHSEIRSVDSTSGAPRVYGPRDRLAVLVEVGRQLAWAEAGCPLWPGDGLLPPINSGEAT